MSLIEQKKWEKRRECWLPAFSTFLTMFSKGFWGLCDKGFRHSETQGICPYLSLSSIYTHFSSTGGRPASYCHGIMSVVCPSVCPSMHLSLFIPFLHMYSLLAQLAEGQQAIVIVCASVCSSVRACVRKHSYLSLSSIYTHF